MGEVQCVLKPGPYVNVPRGSRPVEWKQEERRTDDREGHGGQDRDLAHEQSVTRVRASNYPPGLSEVIRNGDPRSTG